MKRKYVILSVGLVIIGLLIALHLYLSSTTDQRFYLDDQYYGTGLLIDIDNNRLKELEDSDASFAVLVYQISICGRVSAYDFNHYVEEFLEDKEMTFYQILFFEIEGTEMAEHVRVCPSVVIYREGQVTAFLDAVAAEHTEYYKSAEDFGKWLTNYVNLK